MKLPTSLVAVRKINSNVARSSFSPEEIEKAAHLIINAEGIINPIILRRTSLESYEIIDGHFEFYAAVRAREISPLKGEMIQAIILEPENEKVLLDQVELLRKSSNSKPLSVEKDDSEDYRLEIKFSRLEKAFQLQFDELRKDSRNLKQAVDTLANRVQSSGTGDASTNEILKGIEEILKLLRKRSVKSIPETPLNLNSASQDQLETVPGIGPKKASDIIARRVDKKFTSVDDLSEIKGISKSMININRWHECFST